MKTIGKILTGIILFLGIAALLLYLLNYEYIFKGIRVVYFKGHTSAYIEDYTEFDNRTIEAGQSEPWPLHREYNQTKASSRLKQLNRDRGTVAFLIIRNDSIWYEKYAEGYGPGSKTNSFSMAKSIVTALLGRAIKEGHIEDLRQPVANFFPQFDSRLTVGDLASMASGLNWDEDYHSPFSMTARAYFDENIRKQILSLQVTGQPGEEFEYLSGNTQLLGMVIEKATGTTLSQYLSDNFWKPMGMRENALWQLDSKESGMEKAYCCIASNARDFARFGKLFRDFGKWNGEQILDSSFVAKATRPRFEQAPHYGYGFWLKNYYHNQIFYMWGKDGQYTITVPERDLIIVRLGWDEKRKPDDRQYTDDFYDYLEEVFKMTGIHRDQILTSNASLHQP